MDSVERFARLSDLALHAGINVRSLQEAPLGEAPPSSGVCRVRGAVWVLISKADPLDRRIEVLARALGEHAGEYLASRFVPPALRQVIDHAMGRAESEEGGA